MLVAPPANLNNSVSRSVEPARGRMRCNQKKTIKKKKTGQTQAQSLPLPWLRPAVFGPTTLASAQTSPQRQDRVPAPMQQPPQHMHVRIYQQQQQQQQQHAHPHPHPHPHTPPPRRRCRDGVDAALARQTFLASKESARYRALVTARTGMMAAPVRRPRCSGGHATRQSDNDRMRHAACAARARSISMHRQATRKRSSASRRRLPCCPWARIGTACIRRDSE